MIRDELNKSFFNIEFETTETSLALLPKERNVNTSISHVKQVLKEDRVTSTMCVIMALSVFSRVVGLAEKAKRPLSDIRFVPDSVQAAVSLITHLSKSRKEIALMNDEEKQELGQIILQTLEGTYDPFR